MKALSRSSAIRAPITVSPKVALLSALVRMEDSMNKTLPVLAIVPLILLSFVLLFAQDQGSSLDINVRDYCDPTTFNAAVGS